MQHKILVIDDNTDVIKALKILFLINDIDCEGASSPEQGLAMLQSQDYDLVIQDMNFTHDTTSGEEGKTLYHQIRAFNPDLPIILLTAWAQLEMAVKLIKHGAADYIAKPWQDDKLLSSVNNLLEMYQLQQAQTRSKKQFKVRQEQLRQDYDLCGLVFADQNMLSLLETATHVAHSDAQVLITGPNGAGKEKIAELLVANSAYRDRPFIRVNAGALPADLIEAELFGVVSGAYTGATKSREGRFSAADGGTLFLDEIGNLPLCGQQKLLRVLQTGEFEAVGSSKTQKVNVRVISATNADLNEAIARGEFRQDLYYRLNMIELRLPPLAERPDDIVPLAMHFLSSHKSLSEGAQRLLKRYTWPGNVRELQNVIGRAELLAAGERIEATDLGLNASASTLASHEFTIEDITQALDNHQGNVTHAAKSLGLSRQAMYRRMDKFGIKR
ncbi:sigma-54-dependent Fis family transcriptional regulator [Pseudoalteromonas rubra]|uniref:Sigma-54-dependent Fis family transcriptional regulator n=1 Tax=Pseudoalteromonas rubra TaxID=43658 RepID=A0A5S3WL86_9GAMM|nr:sigma-54 dependent transcriptional regulator [Pseudoalteromonas rubra]TMP27521.1 sigma-54-dependent Fis family transcriptional regulator [Pseudoalteromonas rubra]TMP28959.1 sigma-54-dependent Fis family transcriptional regulator [Pseudoalteromonas rubra]